MLLFGYSLVENVWLNREQVKRTNVLVRVLSIYLTMQLFFAFVNKRERRHGERERIRRKRKKNAVSKYRRERERPMRNNLWLFFFLLFRWCLNRSGSNHYFFFSLWLYLDHPTHHLFEPSHKHFIYIQSDLFINITLCLHTFHLHFFYNKMNLLWNNHFQIWLIYLRWILKLFWSDKKLKFNVTFFIWLIKRWKCKWRFLYFKKNVYTDLNIKYRKKRED